jgi:hypothetical protein
MGPTDGMLAKFLSRQMPLPRLPSLRVRISFISVRTLKTLRNNSVKICKKSSVKMLIIFYTAVPG